MKIIYTGTHFPEEIQRRLVDFMKEKGYALDLLKLKTRNASDNKEDLLGYDVIICSGEAYGKDTIEYLSDSLKLLSRHGIGTDEIDKETATKLGIAVCNAAGSLSTSVAECALSLILNVLHEYPALDRSLRAGGWGAHNFAPELRGKTVGLVGFGGIAQKLAAYLAPFECRILAYDPYFNETAANTLGVRKATINEICDQSDIISLHLPLTDETRHLVNMDFIGKMKKTAVLINTSRGPIVDEATLIEALRERKIAGAGLDVFEKEPISQDNPLLALDNTVLLPHIASHTVESQLGAGLMACRNAVAFIEGKKPESLLNPDYMRYVK